MANKTALGKGLASLIPVATDQGAPKPESKTLNKDRHPGISMVPIDQIKANQYQPRREFEDSALQELAQSIRSSGIIQPLVVRKGTVDGFELIAGERRLRAAKLAGVQQIPIVIRRSTDQESLELALIENIQRENLNCIEEAMAYQQLSQEFSLTQEELAKRVGKERATVANYLRLLKHPPEIIEDLKNQTLSFGHGKALLGVDSVEKRILIRNQVLERKLSVRETEALVDSYKKETLSEGLEKVSAAEKNPVQNRLINLSNELTRSLSTRVEVKGNGKKGKITLHYSSSDDLNRLIEHLGRQGHLS